jgi:hypothetical protein
MSVLENWIDAACADLGLDAVGSGQPVDQAAGRLLALSESWQPATPA